MLKRHFVDLECVTPLETGAGGLLVFTQEWSIRRKLLEDAALVESEVMVDVQGAVTPEALQRLNRAPMVEGRALTAAKVSINHQSDGVTGLRFAVKGHTPGRIAALCEAAALRITGMKRIRVGRVAMAGLPAGAWRYLQPQERF